MKHEVLQPITWGGEVTAAVVPELLRGARLNEREAAEVNALPTGKAKAEWYTKRGDRSVYPTAPAVKLPFDHLSNVEKQLLLKRRVIAEGA